MNINKAIQLACENHQKGNFKQAESLYKNILEKQPDNPDILYMIGLLFCQLANYDSAIQYIRKALQFGPADIAGAYCNLGIALQGKGLLDEAISYYQKALQFKPSFAEAYCNLGYALQGKGFLDEAITYYQKALQFKPSFAEAYCNLGYALQKKGLLDESINYSRKAVELNPNFASAYCNLGLALKGKEQFDEAILCYRKAIELNPYFAKAFCNLGAVLQEKEQFDEAILCYRKAVELNPNFAAAYYNIGLTLQDQGQLDEAILCYRKAIELNPNFADAHWNKSIALLLLGKFKQGWKEYQWRWKVKEFLKKSLVHHPHEFSQPAWDGSSPEGKSLFIFSEQGVGDEIMFASCLQDVIDRAKVCIVECDKRLIPIFSRSFPKVVFMERMKEPDILLSQLPQTEMVIPLGSLPKFLRPDFDAFPQESYLIPDAEKVQSWRNRFKALGDGLTVGISWRGGATEKVRRKRSIEHEGWARLFFLSGVKFINLQYGDCEKELREAKDKLNVIIHDWEDADPLKDLDNFAAKIAALDLIISVDNATVHMAGALGKPVWVLLPFVPDWRWMLDREDSPWYPTVRLFRQTSPGDWEAVIERVTEELKTFVQKNKTGKDEIASGLCPSQ